MICAISDENYKALKGFHVDAVVSLMEAGLPLDLKKYLTEFYHKLLVPKSDGSVRSNEQALSYVHLSPAIIRQILKNKQLEEHFVDIIPEVVKLDIQWTATATPLNDVQQYVGIPPNAISDLKQQIEINNKVSHEGGYNPTTSGEATTSQVFKAAPLSAMTTAGQEATVVKDANGNFVNVKDADKETRYTFQRALINELLATISDSSKLSRYGGLYLTMMHSSQVPDYKGKDDLIFVITDADGNILSLDKDGKTDGPRQVMYYEVRMITKSGDTYSADPGLAPVSSIIRAYKQIDKTVSQEQAEQIRQDQLKRAYEIQEYVRKNPDKSIRTVITGGSLGYVDFDLDTRTPLGAVVLDSPLKVHIQETQGQPYIKGFKNGGAAYFMIPGVQSPILIQRNDMTDELITKIASMLVDDIVKEFAGERNLLPPSRKLDLVKQYLNNTPTWSLTLDNGELLLSINGARVDLNDKETARRTIVNYFNTYQNTPGFNPSELDNHQKATALKETDPDYLSRLRKGIIVQRADGRYEKMTKPTFNINKIFSANNDPFNDYSIENGVFKDGPPMLYYDWLKQHTYVNYKLNTENKIVSLNSYFKYKLTDEAKSILYPQEEKPQETPVPKDIGLTEQGSSDTQAPSEAGKSFSERIKKLREQGRAKTVDQKFFSEVATQKQIEEAREWYEKSPLSKYFPFNAMFNMVNSGVIAEWTMNGITLYKGSDYSDLYHEAWHGFAQGFLTRKQKTDLYNEIRESRTGSFTNIHGKKIKFSKATHHEIEEYLAEDFRKYMLSGGRSLSTPVRNTIFRKIWNFLKEFFGGTTRAQMLINDQSLNTIRELYEKVRIGNINEKDFSRDNALYNILHKGPISVDKLNPVELDSDVAIDIVSTIDSIFSTFVDEHNARNPDDRITNAVFSSTAGREAAYESVLEELITHRQKLIEKIARETNPQTKAEQERNLSTLTWMIDNFGDTKDPRGKKQKDENGYPIGVIAYHNLKSEFLAFEDKFDAEDNNLPDYLFKGGNELSVFDRGRSTIWYLVRGLHRMDEGKPVLNRLGFPELVDFVQVRRKLSQELAGSVDRFAMRKRLEDLTGVYPYLSQLIFKLGDPASLEDDTFKTWGDFFQTFNSYKIPLPTMILDKTGTTFTSKVGEAAGEHKIVQRRWGNQFTAGSTVHDPKLLVKIPNKAPVLDIQKVLDKYPEINRGNLIQALNDMGVPLSRTEEIVEEIQTKKRFENIGRYLRERLVALKTEKIIVDNLKTLFVKNVKNRYGEEKNESSMYDDFAKLEAKYSGQYSDMVSTPSGDSRSEYSLNNSMTATAKELNNARNYNDLTNKSGYYDKLRNPLMRVSKRMISMFNPDGSRTNIQYQIENLNGLAKTEDDEATGVGTSSSSADKFTKFILDLHLLIQRGISENPRHGEKSTSVATFCRFSKAAAPYSKDGKLLIDMEHFLPGDNTIWEKVYEMVVPYLYAEHDRIRIMRNLKPGAPELNYPEYAENGKYFSIFDSILSDTTKSVLYGIKGSLEGFLKADNNNARTLLKDINKDFKKYYQDLFDQAEKRFSDGGFVADSLLNRYLRTYDKDNPFKSLTKQQMTTVFLKTFEFNTWINNIESTIMHYGDPAQYAKTVEFHKRIAMASSTGDIFASDSTTIDYVNQKGYQYAKAHGFPEKRFSNRLNAGVMEDPYMKSVYYSEIYLALYNSAIKRNYSDAGAKAIAEKEANAYVNMEVGNAQGWITFDSYRALGIASGKWSQIQEYLYQQIVKGEYVSPEKVIEYFPVKKYQYFGPLDTKAGLPVIGAHKYSLFPLIPNVINNSPTLQALHERMMRDGIDYATLKSGSKITTVTNQGKMDKFFSDVSSRTFDNSPFTPNVVYLDYLKDQQNVNESFKEEVTISTQMRKVIEEGFMENGVPTDVKMDFYSWRKLSEAEKLKRSPKYRLVIDYEKAVATLTEEKKKEFIKEIGWEGAQYGTITPKLLSVIDKELARQDLGDHEREIIQLKNATSNQLLYDDLSYHLSAEKIERAFTAMINRKLIRQKMTGESLVQVSGLGFESQKYMDFRGKLTYQEQMQYGTNDLPYYRPEGRTDANGNKITQAAKAKIAFMPAFNPLLQLIHNDGHPIQNIDRLNEMIRNEVWLNKLDHRRMITIIGPRIPVEGHNSMEFLEVWEFLPRTAGNIIVLPAEIVAKSGSDFDVDKVSMMIPNITIRDGKTELFKNLTIKEARAIYEELKANTEDILKYLIATNTEEVVQSAGQVTFHAGIHENKLMQAIFGNDEYLDKELIKIIKDEGKLPSFEDFFDQLNGTKMAENEFMHASQKLLQHPDSYSSLVRPNGTFTLDPIINGTENLEGIRDYVTDYNPKNTVQGLRKKISGSKLFEYGYNSYVHQINKVSQEALAIAAVDNTANVIFNRVGAHMAADYFDRTSKAPKGQGVTKELKLHLPYNKMKDENGEDTISLSHVADANGQLRISGNIEQMINLLLEIAKNDSAYYLQLNKEVIPTLLFLDQAGVPIDHLIYFASQPILRKYYDQIRIARSPVADALKKAPEKRNFFKNKARAIMYQEVLKEPNNFAVDSPEASFNPRLNVPTIQRLYNKMNTLIKNNPKAFNKDRLYDNILEPNEEFTDEDKAVLLHWFEIEDMATAVRDIKIRMNFDTKRSASAYLALSKSKQIEKLSSDGRIPEHIVENILKDSAISSMAGISVSQGDNTAFMIDFLKPLFPIRTNKKISDFLMSKMDSMDAMEEIESTFGDAEKFTTRFFNELMSYIFQNKLRDFKIGNITKYRNMNAVEALDVQQIPYLQFGAYVKDNVMYYDMDQLVNDFSKRNYTSDSYKKRGLARLNQTDFKTAKEFYNFVFEREYIRSYLTPTDVGTDTHFLNLKVINEGSKGMVKKANEDNDAYQKRLNLVTYEQYIRDKALENIGNAKKIFEGEGAFSSQVMDMIDEHDLTNQYPILGMLTENVSRQNVRNLQLLDTDLTSDKTEAFHKTLKDLANPAVIKVQDHQTNLRISELFAKFPMVAFLQSGLTSSGAFSLTRLVPTKQFMDFIQGAVNEFMSTFKPEYLETFYQKFISENSKRSRYKDYTRDDVSAKTKTSLREAGVIPLMEGNIMNIYPTGNRKFLIYSPNGLTKARIDNTIRQSPDLLFVYDLATNHASDPHGTEGLFTKHTTTNQTLGLPTLVYYNRADSRTGKNTSDQSLTALSDKTLEDNKVLIDEAIQNLKDMQASGSIPVFSLHGYGQRLIGLEADGVTPITLISGKPGLKTFMYLSKRLFEEFNYVNRNYDVQEVAEPTIETAKEVLAKNQPLNDEEVRNLIRNCL